MLKKAVKGGLKAALNAVSPLFSRKSTLDPIAARELLEAFSPRPQGTARADNRVVSPVCDLQIVIPAYNVEPYLAACMDSVLAQETKYVFRVVLIDDGSTDGTPAIADRYAGDPRVTVIHQENRGFSGARNRGLRELFGKYLMFVDSDDRLCPGAVEALLDTAFRFDCDVVEGGAWYLTGEETTLMYRYASAVPVADPAGVFHGQPWAKVYKSEIFARLQFPEGFWYEDSILAFLVWPGVRTAYTSPQMAYVHRLNQTGITRTSRGRPKAADTYWITEALMAERQEAGLPVDEGYFRQVLHQIHLNQFRVAGLPREVQESIFVLSCSLLERYFPEEIRAAARGNLAKSLRTRDFGRFRMCCQFF